jgi:streptomycin 6-kinase
VKEKITSLFEEHITRWQLIVDGNPIITPGARLLPVRYNNNVAMLKVATVDEEKFGGQCMNWWEGKGAARVLAIQDNAILLERAMGNKNLVEFVNKGLDDEATRIICHAIAKLHQPSNKPLPKLTPLPIWFRTLKLAAMHYKGLFIQSMEAADILLANPENIGVLHGDIHHHNVLYFGSRGWLAIDPKGLYGERTFDYANLFCNPDRAIANDPSIFLKRVQIVSELAQIDRKRLLQWILAWCGLSAAWMIEDGNDGGFDMGVAQLAYDELNTTYGS